MESTLEVQEKSVYVPSNCSTVVLRRPNTTVALPATVQFGWKCRIITPEYGKPCDIVPNDEDDRINGILMSENVVMRASGSRIIDVTYVHDRNFIVKADPPVQLVYLGGGSL